MVARSVYRASCWLRRPGLAVLGLAGLSGIGVTLLPLGSQAAAASSPKELRVCTSGCTYHTVSGALDAASPGDTISIGPGTYDGGFTLNGVNLIGEKAGHVVISGAVNDGKNDDKVVSTTGTVRMANLVITGKSSSAPFGIFNSGTLRVENTTVTATTGEGVANLGTLSLVDSSVRDNVSTVRHAGPGVTNDGTATLKDTTVSGNVTGGFGGGIFNDRGKKLTLTGSTVSDNRAGGTGGGIENDGDLKMAASTVTKNTAGRDGGGIANSSDLDLEGSTVSHNRAGRDGGGIFNTSHFMVLRGTRIVDNVPNNCVGPDCPAVR